MNDDRTPMENTLREALDEFDHHLTQWARAYPEGVFPEPDMGVVRTALEARGITIDCVSASTMRHVVKQLDKLFQPVRAALSAAPAQEPVAWYWQHVMQQSQGVIESGFSGTRVEVTDDAMWDGQVATVVTELHAGRKLLPPKFAAAVGLPTEIPASPLPQEPQEGKELTEERINELAAEYGDELDQAFIFNRLGRFSAVAFARAIERELRGAQEGKAE